LFEVTVRETAVRSALFLTNLNEDLPMQLLTKKTYLPNLVIIGAMKGGTTSLHKYLSYHPQIAMSDFKELDFFIEQFNWQHGLDWYRANFTTAADVRGEASPNYTKCHLFTGVPERMSRILPEAKLIYLVRDPIKRAISHYIHAVARGRENRSLDDALICDRENNYINTSLYFMQIERYLQYYSPEQILLVTQESLATDRLNTLQTVFRFLNVDSEFQDPRFSQASHESASKKQPTPLRLKLLQVPGGRLISKAISLVNPDSIGTAIAKPKLSSTSHQHLTELFHDDLQKLRQFTGQSFANWSV
jgi:Sulfotransferase domain